MPRNPQMVAQVPKPQQSHQHPVAAASLLPTYTSDLFLSDVREIHRLGSAVAASSSSSSCSVSSPNSTEALLQDKVRTMTAAVCSTLQNLENKKRKSELERSENSDGGENTTKIMTQTMQQNGGESDRRCDIFDGSAISTVLSVIRCENGIPTFVAPSPHRRRDDDTDDDSASARTTITTTPLHLLLETLMRIWQRDGISAPSPSNQPNKDERGRKQEKNVNRKSFLPTTQARLLGLCNLFVELSMRVFDEFDNDDDDGVREMKGRRESPALTPPALFHMDSLGLPLHYAAAIGGGGSFGHHHFNTTADDNSGGTRTIHDDDDAVGVGAEKNSSPLSLPLFSLIVDKMVSFVKRLETSSSSERHHFSNLLKQILTLPSAVPNKPFYCHYKTSPLLNTNANASLDSMGMGGGEEGEGWGSHHHDSDSSSSSSFQTSFFIACERGHVALAKWMVETLAAAAVGVVNSSLCSCESTSSSSSPSSSSCESLSDAVKSLFWISHAVKEEEEEEEEDGRVHHPSSSSSTTTTALHYAVESQSLKMVQYILNTAVEVGKEEEEVKKQVTGSGGDVSAKKEEMGEKGEERIDDRSNPMPLVQKLILSQDENGNTALHLACALFLLANSNNDQSHATLSSSSTPSAAAVTMLHIIREIIGAFRNPFSSSSSVSSSSSTPSTTLPLTRACNKRGHTALHIACSNSSGPTRKMGREERGRSHGNDNNFFTTPTTTDASSSSSPSSSLMLPLVDLLLNELDECDGLILGVVSDEEAEDGEVISAAATTAKGSSLLGEKKNKRGQKHDNDDEALAVSKSMRSDKKKNTIIISPPPLFLAACAQPDVGIVKRLVDFVTVKKGGGGQEKFAALRSPLEAEEEALLEKIQRQLNVVREEEERKRQNLFPATLSPVIVSESISEAIKVTKRRHCAKEVEMEANALSNNYNITTTTPQRLINDLKLFTTPLFTSSSSLPSSYAKRNGGAEDAAGRRGRGLTALHIAAKEGHLSVCRCILFDCSGSDYNSDGNSTNSIVNAREDSDAGLTPLCVAIMMNVDDDDDDVHDENNNNSGAISAQYSDSRKEVEERRRKRRSDRFEIVKLLLEAGADPNLRTEGGGRQRRRGQKQEDVNNSIAVGEFSDHITTASSGMLPLHLAVATGDAAIVQLLLAKGAMVGKYNVDSLSKRPNDDGAENSHLFLPSSRNNILSRSFDANFLGRTPLHIAASSGRRDLVALLLAAGSDPWARDCSEIVMNIVDNNDDGGDSRTSVTTTTRKSRKMQMVSHIRKSLFLCDDTDNQDDRENPADSKTKNLSSFSPSAHNTCNELCQWGDTAAPMGQTALGAAVRRGGGWFEAAPSTTSQTAAAVNRQLRQQGNNNIPNAADTAVVNGVGQRASLFDATALVDDEEKGEDERKKDGVQVHCGSAEDTLAVIDLLIGHMQLQHVSLSSSQTPPRLRCREEKKEEGKEENGREAAGSQQNCFFHLNHHHHHHHAILPSDLFEAVAVEAAAEQTTMEHQQQQQQHQQCFADDGKNGRLTKDGKSESPSSSSSSSCHFVSVIERLLAADIVSPFTIDLMRRPSKAKNSDCDNSGAGGYSPFRHDDDDATPSTAELPSSTTGRTLLHQAAIHNNVKAAEAIIKHAKRRAKAERRRNAAAAGRSSCDDEMRLLQRHFQCSFQNGGRGGRSSDDEHEYVPSPVYCLLNAQDNFQSTSSHNLQKSRNFVVDGERHDHQTDQIENEKEELREGGGDVMGGLSSSSLVGGLTPLQYAIQLGHVEMIQFLLSVGLDDDDDNEDEDEIDGETDPSSSCDSLHRDFVNVSVCGGGCGAKNNSNVTALHMAILADVHAIGTALPPPPSPSSSLQSSTFPLLPTGASSSATITRMILDAQLALFNNHRHHKQQKRKSEGDEKKSSSSSSSSLQSSSASAPPSSRAVPPRPLHPAELIHMTSTTSTWSGKATNNTIEAEEKVTTMIRADNDAHQFGVAGSGVVSPLSLACSLIFRDIMNKANRSRCDDDCGHEDYFQIGFGGGKIDSAIDDTVFSCLFSNAYHPNNMMMVAAGDHHGRSRRYHHKDHQQHRHTNNTPLHALAIAAAEAEREERAFATCDVAAGVCCDEQKDEVHHRHCDLSMTAQIAIRVGRRLLESTQNSNTNKRDFLLTKDAKGLSAMDYFPPLAALLVEDANEQLLCGRR